MRTLAWLSLVAILSCGVLAQQQTPPPSNPPVFREPFTLKLPIDDKQNYEERFDRIPYVSENDVYLFLGDAFGINLTATKDEILAVTYQPELTKADVQFTFRQLKMVSGTRMMLLIVQNNLDREFSYEALMTVPGKKDIIETHVLPVKAHLSSYESWPQPLVKLVLRNFRFPVISQKQDTNAPTKRNERA